MTGTYKRVLRMTGHALVLPFYVAAGALAIKVAHAFVAALSNPASFSWYVAVFCLTFVAELGVGLFCLEMAKDE